MQHRGQVGHNPAEIEASLLAVLLSAETVRAGATALLEALGTAFEESASAVAVRDRDGLTLHVLAELGTPRVWPARLDPKIAIGAQPAVDAGTGIMVVPLRADGRVIGALLLADVRCAASLLREDGFHAHLDTAAAVLHQLVARTDAELQRRATALRSVDAIIEGMAHQIANPLTGASAIAQLLAEELENEGQRAAVVQIRQELGRAFTVLRDLHDFQRDTHAQDGVLDLNAVVERVIRFRGYAIREMGIALQLETAPAFIPVRADARGVEQAILLALRFAELQSHGTINRSIAVRVSERPGVAEIGVTDSGPGTVPELAPAYFDLAFRAESASPDGDNPDLGLVDSILRAGGGRLEVRGSKADGTTLSLVLPRAATPSPISRSRIKA